ncbi:stalk domain-containing protein [Neobacillus sp. D3-1R]|uniref:stalk domain-containing protein n=1 Tax=Neobacillus sp. D3-1R TaxID=3445778 RepID=UPI003F9FAB7D
MKFRKIQFSFILMVSLFFICSSIPTFAEEDVLLGYDEGKQSKAFFNADGSITVKGITKDSSIQMAVINVENLDNSDDSQNYETTIGSDGHFTITTAPLQGFTYRILYVGGENYFYDEYMLVSKKMVTAELLEEKKTKVAIKKKWKEINPKHKGQMFMEEPLLKAPYKAGKLKASFLNDALNMTNFVRYIANMNSNIKLNNSLVNSAQHKAALLEVSYDSNSPHNPPKPKDMSEEFYETANPGWENLHFGQFSLANAVTGFMDDPGEHNLQRAGHRTSILSPNLTSVGFGYSGYFSLMHMSSSDPIELGYHYDYIAWPSKGNFPISFAEGASVWSLALNENRYEEIDKKKVKLTITNQRTKNKWVLTNPVGYVNNGYFYANPYLLTFKPNNLDYQEGDTLTVLVEGIRKSDGSPSSLTYDVHLFDLDEITVVIDNQEQKYIQPPVISEGRTMVPMRSIFEELGAKVTWESKTKSVYAKKGNTTVTLKIGSKVAYVNKKPVKLDAAPIILNKKTTMVPVRFISDALNTKFSYDPKYKVIEISTK